KGQAYTPVIRAPAAPVWGLSPARNPHTGGPLPNSLILSGLGLTLRQFHHRDHLVYRVNTAHHTRIERAWHTPGAADASGMRQYQYCAHPDGRIAGSHPVVAAATPHGTLAAPTTVLHTVYIRQPSRWRRAMCSVQATATS